MALFEELQTQRKRTAKKIFSPSDCDRFAVIYHEANDHFEIIKSSEILLQKDDEVEVRNGDIATLIISGTYHECRAHLKSSKKSLKRNEINSDQENETDDEHEIGDQPFDKQMTTSTSFIQRPRQGFRTPAARRREIRKTNHTGSPIVSRRHNHSSLNQRQILQELRTPSNIDERRVLDNREKETRSEQNGPHSSNKDSDMEMEVDRSFARLQTASENQTSSIRALKEELIKLTKKMVRFSTVLSTKNDQVLHYQDPNDKEVYPDEINFNDENLLNISGRDPGDYARKVLRKLFTSDELATSVLPSRYDHLYLKKPLETKRFELLNRAIRVNYRISKNNYANFYARVIQKTLSDCVYNEGTRRQSKSKIIQNTTRTTNDLTGRTTTEAEQPSSPHL